MLRFFFNEELFKGKAVLAGEQGACWVTSSMGRPCGSGKLGYVFCCSSMFTYLNRVLMGQLLWCLVPLQLQGTKSSAEVHAGDGITT